MASHGTAARHIEFRAGIRQDIAPQVAPEGALVDAVNVRYRAAIGGIDGRPGQTILSSIGAGVIYGGIGIISRIGDCGLLGTNGNMYAHEGTFRAVGSYSGAQPIRKRYGLVGPVPGGGSSSDGFEVATPACATNTRGDVLVATTTSSSTTRVMTAYVESASGARVWHYELPGTSVSKVQAVACGTVFVLIWQTSANELQMMTVTPTGTGVTQSSVVPYSSLSSGSANWDTSAYDATSWLVIFQNGAAQVAVRRVDLTGSNLAVDVIAVTGTVFVSAYGDAAHDHAWFGIYDEPTAAGNVKYTVYTASSMTALLAPATILSGADVYGPPLIGPVPENGGDDPATTCSVFVRYVSSSGPDYTRATLAGQINTTGSSAGLTEKFWHVIPISKPAEEARIWVITANGDGSRDYFQQVLCLRFTHVTSTTPPVVELSAPIMPTMQAYSPELDTGRYGAQYFHAVAHGAESDFFAFPFVLESDDQSPVFLRVAVNVYEYATYDQQQIRDSSEMGQHLVVAGQPTDFFANAERSAELGFAQYPIITRATITAAGAGSIPAGTYRYRATFEWSDMYGRVHRSAPSEPVEYTLATPSSSIEVRVTSLSCSQRMSGSGSSTDPQVVLYRTVDGGASYKRIMAATAYQQSTGVAVFVDDNVDGDIRDNGAVYSEEATENDLAPSCRYIRATETRVWCGGLFESGLLQASKYTIPTEPPVFVGDPAFQVPINGDCTGIAYMDGEVIAFTRNSVQVISGDGPDDRGIGSFAPPRTVSREIGCVDARAILETGIGVFFLSERGIYLLPRGFSEPRFIGEPVHRLTWQYPVCRGATLYSDGLYRLARFLLQNEDGDEHIELIYDLDVGAWSYDTHSILCSAIGQWPSGRLLGFDDFSENAGYLESPDPPTSDTPTSGVNIDGGIGFTSSITTADIRPWGLGGFGRLQHGTVVFSEAGGVDTLTLTVYTDGNATAKSWVPGASTGTDYRRVTPSGAGTNQECTTVSATVAISRPDAATGLVATRGPTLHGLTLEQMAVAGARRVGDTGQ